MWIDYVMIFVYFMVYDNYGMFYIWFKLIIKLSGSFFFIIYYKYNYLDIIL